MLYAIAKVAGPERMKQLIPAIANYAGLDLLQVAYNNIGILKFENDLVSGEQFLVTRVLKKNLGGVARPVIFDVGANVGKYSMLLAKTFPQAQIYAFEPNENTFKQLAANVGNAVKCVNIGMGSEEKIEKIYTYSDNLASSHASIYEEVFHTFHKRDDVVEIEFQLTTLDLFCEKKKVTGIDFLKIDTEGNELNVLKGARETLSERKVKIIQFEFGECDVFSRVFLQDFYAMLPDYNIYRLDSERLIPLFEYASTNEIFRYQNFIAVRKDFPFQNAQ
jgi:FkbM family methyltransferase